MTHPPTTSSPAGSSPTASPATAPPAGQGVAKAGGVPGSPAPAAEPSSDGFAGTPGWRLVALREISVKLHDKAFIGSTVFLLVAIVGGLVLSNVLSGRSSSHTVAVMDGAGVAVVEAADQIGGDDEVTARTADDVAQAEEWVLDGTVDAALLPASEDAVVPGGSAPSGEAGQARWEVLGDTGVDGGLREHLSAAVAAVELEANAEAAGTTPSDVLAGSALAERLLDSDALPEGLVYGIGFGFAMLFYLTALTFGIAIAQSVVEEKQSRVVEILVAAVPVRQLLAGKVVGNSVLAIGQVVLLVSVGLVALSLIGSALALSPVLEASGWFVVFFVLGFAALACLWAVAGSVATRQEDLQYTSTPMTFVVLLALIGGVSADGTFQTVLSFIPLASTVAMPSRMLAGDVPLWEPVVAALVVAATAVLLVRLGARLYEGSVLQTDRRVTLREAFQRS